MTVKSSITTKGFSEYLERLARGGKDIDAVAGQALQAGGAVLVPGMQRRVRKGTHNLEEHISASEVKRDGNFSYIEVGLIDVDAETARYGNANEYGTSSMPAQPYIRPALDEDMSKARAEMRREFEEAEVL